MQNFAEIVRSFLMSDGAIQVRDKAELESTLRKLLGDKIWRESLGRNALQVVRQNLGAVERTVEMIVKHFEDSEVYVAPKGS
jgi:3-deoxy-D-manno-octulosonic-acid transferase